MRRLARSIFVVCAIVAIGGCASPKARNELARGSTFAPSTQPSGTEMLTLDQIEPKPILPSPRATTSPSSNPPLEALALYADARAKILANQRFAGISVLEKAIKLDPNYSRGYTTLGMAYHDAGRLKESLECASKAIELEPENAEAYFRRGDFLRLSKRYGEAMVDYDRAMRLDPDLASVYIGRGAIHFEEKRYEAAIQDFTTALKLDSRLQQAARYRGYAYLALGRDAEAERDFSRAIAAVPTLRGLAPPE